MAELLLPFFGFAFSAALTPGPNNVMVTASGANFGYRRSLPHIFGITFGFSLMLIGCGLGLGGLFRLYPELQEILALVATVYLLYLAWRIANAGRTSGNRKKSRPLSLLQAAAFQWVNPKAWVVSLSAVAAFAGPGEGFARNVLVIASLFLLVSFVSASSWTLFGTAVGRLLTSGRRLTLFNWSMGALLAASVLPVLLRGF